MKKQFKKLIKGGSSCLALAIIVICLASCAPRQPKVIYKKVVVEKAVTPPAGTVQYIWEEPMVDVVDVPPGLDPEGYYYRPAHREIVEIRQGRWQQYKLPDRR
ncbi:MAG: hypothetical protein D6808_00210 [Candidatus Dadabacteria bacterium]|nr:MAG: hypothetical protein D6808_00210 [Candidatus Dadabacteria bacterium]